jgi:uncharacterized protein (TIGR00255 family)
MKSMTGYGTAEGKVGKGILFVELKGVNHRFSEINVKIPGRMSILEGRIRKFMQAEFDRGKIDVFFKEKEPLFGGVSISVDLELARRYQAILKKLKRDLGLSDEIDFFKVVGLDKILHVEEGDGSYDRLWGQIEVLLKRATAGMMKMRIKEGAHIRDDQLKRVERLSRLVEDIQSRSQHVRDGHMERIRSKINGAISASEIDEQRLAQEAAYLGGRQDIAEETVRLISHIKQYRHILHAKDAVGRRLDFLLQEMNREANTIGAKASDAAVSRMVVDCKAELERLKEQVQNVE